MCRPRSRTALSACALRVSPAQSSTRFYVLSCLGSSFFPFHCYCGFLCRFSLMC
ncbi:hypothetical protein BGW80DRAFT_1348119 [Lactifluus volemus]|nr:hypothetical protein BGW80DRAFT_1348119 [Lactifluus volemus]